MSLMRDGFRSFFFGGTDEEVVSRAADRLPAEEADVLLSYYGIGRQPQSARVISHRLMLEEGRVSIIAKRALSRMKEA